MTLVATSIVSRVAGAVVLFAVVVVVFSAWRGRGEGLPQTSLARAQSFILVIGASALAIVGLTDSDVAYAVWFVAVLSLIVVLVARRRRGEPSHQAVEIDDSLHAEIADLVRDGQTIEAIALTKDRTGAGLVTAKLTVDRVASAEGISAKLYTTARALRTWVTACAGGPASAAS